MRSVKLIYITLLRYYQIEQLQYIFRSTETTDSGTTKKVIDVKSRFNITLAAYDIKGKLLYVDEAASANIFQICNGSFIEFDAALNFGTRYDLRWPQILQWLNNILFSVLLTIYF